MLRTAFQEICERYTVDTAVISTLWTEVESSYSNKKRHYHTFAHLENMYIQLQEVKSNITNWNAVLFALYYHDIVYNSLKSDNEEKSAVLAELRMKQIGVDIETVTLTATLIIATKKHTVSSTNDVNYFTDVDLSILGQPWSAYEMYFKNVRKEYSIYPDLVYKPGRRKVLQHFLEMENIFKTKHFNSKFEQQAKLNLQKELDILS